LKIAVNTRLLLKGKLQGIGWFEYETLKRITIRHPEHQFYFIFDRKFNPEFIFSENVTPLSLPPQARHPLLYYLWFNYSITYLLKKIRADLFLSPDGYLSLQTSVKSLPVIHDLSFEHYPQNLPLSERIYNQHFFPKFARKASRIATVSEFSKQDIIKHYAISPDKIDVVYSAAKDVFYPINEQKKAETRRQFSDGKPYFVFVGALLPRKNLSHLFFAFDTFKKNHFSEVKLLIVGTKKWWAGEIEEAYNQMQYKSEVVFTGHLSNHDLNRVIASSLAVTFVSNFEGFGVPIQEGFFCEVPVITSNVSSMPEIAGNAALLVNPFSVDSITQAMLKIYCNEKLRQELIEKGKIKRQEFTWQRTADLLWNSVEKCLNF